MPLFDANTLTHFFEDVGNMGLSNHMRVQLAMEGIVTPDNFTEFDEGRLAAIFQNLNKPPKIMTTTAGWLREVAAFKVSAKSKMRLKGAMLIAKFYKNVGHPL
jgi:hypothetical protein